MSDEELEFYGCDAHWLNLAGNLGRGWIDEVGVAEAFAIFLKAKLEAALPGATVKVTAKKAGMGVCEGFIGGDPYLPAYDKMQAIVMFIRDSAFVEFCNAPESAPFRVPQ